MSKRKHLKSCSPKPGSASVIAKDPLLSKSSRTYENLGPTIVLIVVAVLAIFLHGVMLAGELGYVTPLHNVDVRGK